MNGALPALAQLVFNGSVTLMVGGIAGLEQRGSSQKSFQSLSASSSVLLGYDGPVIVGGVQPLKVFPRHAAADDAGQRQRGAVDALPRPGVRLVARIIVVVSRNDPAWFSVALVFQAVPALE
ncbi:hypothetical protein [Bradyrhizobium sp.]|uniref:hypothetical protein n=1 Tax=Bradyrhizobium sp. TaxID=376 RepID=UPI004037B390